MYFFEHFSLELDHALDSKVKNYLWQIAKVINTW